MTSTAAPRIVRALCLLTLAACAAPERTSSAPPGPTERTMNVAKVETYLAQRESELRLAAADAQPDCARVCMLVEQICGLSRRICDLAGQDAGLRARCDDATARCTRARSLAAGRCACQPAQP